MPAASWTQDGLHRRPGLRRPPGGHVLELSFVVGEDRRDGLRDLLRLLLGAEVVERWNVVRVAPGRTGSRLWPARPAAVVVASLPLMRSTSAVRSP